MRRLLLFLSQPICGYYAWVSVSAAMGVWQVVGLVLTRCLDGLGDVYFK